MNQPSGFNPRRLAKMLVPEVLKHQWRERPWPPTRLADLPGTSRSYGPARRWVRAERYFQWHPGSVREVLPRQSLPPLTVTSCTPIHPRFFEHWHAEVPAAGVIELPQARLVGPDGWIVGARDSYLVDASYWSTSDGVHNLHEHYMLLRRFAPPVRQLPGRVLSLASDFIIGGFGHFLHDSLTRLLLLERAGVELREFDWVYWPHLATSTVRRLVRATGIPPEKIVTWDRNFDLECASLTATTFPGRPAHIAPVYADFLRRRFAPPPKGSSRRIYLARNGHRRNFRNAEEIEAVLVRHGYEIVQPHADAFVLEKCAAATEVVAIEGANFFNVFSCAPGTKVLLILPDAGPTLPYTLTLALAAGLRVFLAAAQSLDQPRIDPGIADIHLDPAVLNRALDEMATP